MAGEVGRSLAQRQVDNWPCDPALRWLSVTVISSVDPVHGEQVSPDSYVEKSQNPSVPNGPFLTNLSFG